MTLPIMKPAVGRSLTLASAALLLAFTAAFAQTDEIQVYDAGIAPVGTFNLTLHNNYIVNGIKGQAFPGAVAADKSWNGVPEWAYGVTPWFEAGLYMPLYSHDDTMGWGLNGFKLRTLFVVPHADDRKFVYGVNFEFSDNNKRWDTSKYTQEMRPIIGWHLNPVDIIVNPIVDTQWDNGLKGFDFVPSARVAYNFPSGWAVAGEEYADFGDFDNLLSVHDQVHQLFAVVDHTGGFVDVEGGVGFGVTNTTDKLTFKLILSKDLYTRK